MLWKIAYVGRENPVRLAAYELSRCIRLMDDTCDTAVLTYPEVPESREGLLLLGICPKVAERVPDPVQDDSFLIRVENGSGEILGSNARSVLMGAYRFLREAGCEWVRPGADGEIIPKIDLSRLTVHVDETASYRHRAVCIEGAVSFHHVADMVEWMPKLGYNAWFNQFNNPVTFYRRWYDHEANPLMEKEPVSSPEISAIRYETVRLLKERGLMYHEAGHGWTCEPFGIPGEAWESAPESCPKGTKQYLALVNGKRELWNGIALNTNLCYSNPEVRSTMARAVVDRCRENPDIDYLHIWLADGSNNHCECPECAKKIPSDWYFMLLNDVDAALTAAGISTRIVMLLYHDLLWAPETERLIHPERFVLMFAPISRTYTRSFADRRPFDETTLVPYVRNRISAPSSVEENLARLRQWQAVFSGDSFDFDYHFMWAHFQDPGDTHIARVLFKDMQSLKDIGINGMVSCQNQRVFFPSALGMTAMAAALWNRECEYEPMADRYYSAAWGAKGHEVRGFLEAVTEAFDPEWMFQEKPAVCPENAEKLEKIPALAMGMRSVITGALASGELLPGQCASWQYLKAYTEFVSRLSRVMLLRAQGNREGFVKALNDLYEEVRLREPELNRVFDVLEFQYTFGRYLREK